MQAYDIGTKLLKLIIDLFMTFTDLMLKYMLNLMGIYSSNLNLLHCIK